MIAQLTNAIPPSITIPLPAGLASWIAANGFVYYIGSKLLIKWLDGFEPKYPWLSYVVWSLEHITFTKNVAPLSQRGANAPTPNGLPTTAPVTTNVVAK